MHLCSNRKCIGIVCGIKCRIFARFFSKRLCYFPSIKKGYNFVWEMERCWIMTNIFSVCVSFEIWSMLKMAWFSLSYVPSFWVSAFVWRAPQTFPFFPEKGECHSVFLFHLNLRPVASSLPCSRFYPLLYFVRMWIYWLSR